MKTYSISYRIVATLMPCLLCPTRCCSCSSSLSMGAPGGKVLRRPLRCTLLWKHFTHLESEGNDNSLIFPVLSYNVTPHLLWFYLLKVTI